MDFGDAMRIGRGLFLFEESRTLLVGGKHDLEQRILGAGRFLRDLADARVLRHAD